MNNISVGVGTSILEDSFDAGKQAALEALIGYQGFPDVLVIFCAMKYNHKELLAGIGSVTGNIPMSGVLLPAKFQPKDFHQSRLS
jgi:hypothetical protein